MIIIDWYEYLLKDPARSKPHLLQVRDEGCLSTTQVLLLGGVHIIVRCNTNKPA